MTSPTPPYQPDDASLTPALLDALLTPTGQSLFAEILAHPALTVANIAQLRKNHPPALVHAALVLAKLQPSARQKFPNLTDPSPRGGLTPDPSRIIFATPEALQQSSSSRVANHKAARFAQIHPTEIYDLCAGIGGDSLSLASLAPTPAPVTTVDLSATRLHCLTLNARSLHLPITTLCADVTTIDIPPHALIHIDPSRRNLGKRNSLYQDMIPPPAFLDRLLAHSPAVALKLSPAVDFSSLPPGHLELISENRSVVQALLHTGHFLDTFPHVPAPHPPSQTSVLSPQHPLAPRTATLLSPHHPPFSFTATPSAPPSLAPAPLTYFYELDGALTRSQLAYPFAQQHDLLPLTQDCGYVTSPTLLHHSACIPFEFLDSFPFSEKRAAETLRAHKNTPSPGPIEIKTRGLPNIDTDALQKKLTSHFPLALTLLIYRDSRSQVRAILARRLTFP